MKNYLIILCAFIGMVSLVGCSKDDEPKLSSVVVNITYDGKSASPSIVNLYDYDLAKDFDKSNTAVYKFGDNRELLDKDGNVIKPAYSSPTTIGVNTFEDVKDGKYIAVALYKPDGFTFSNFYYYGYTTINVNSGLSTFTFKFLTDSPRGEFIEF